MLANVISDFKQNVSYVLYSGRKLESGTTEEVWGEKSCCNETSVSRIFEMRSLYLLKQNARIFISCELSLRKM